MTKPIRVLLVSDQPVYRAGLAALLADVPTLELIDAVVPRSAAELIHARRSDLVLWHAPALRGGAGEGGITAVVRRWAIPPSRVIVCGEDGQPAALREVWRAGVAGWLSQASTPADLVVAFRATAGGASLWTAEQLARIRQAEDDERKWQALTEREREVLQLVAAGWRNKEIACRLGIQPKTVEYHVNHVLGKLAVHSRVEAAVWAEKASLDIEMDEPGEIPRF